MDLMTRIRQGERRAVGRFITLLENHDPEAIELLKANYQFTGRAYVVGVTGPPGAGKSTLTDKMTRYLLDKGLKVGIVAVDPTSPFTGGALLGDRVRMSDIATESGVFIRSMGARGHLGGLSKATGAAIKVLDLYGCDWIFVETVGVGQSEVDVVKICDTVLMVAVPGMGDDIQAIKAGIMEIADIFAVNKADREGAPRTVREIEQMLDFQSQDWRPPVRQVIAPTNQGVEALLADIEAHRRHLETTETLIERRVLNAYHELLSLVQQAVVAQLNETAEAKERLKDFAEQIAMRAIDPYTACAQIMRGLNNHEN